VKLLDFGLATMPGAHLTPGITPGTVPYMSPEQTRGESVTSQTDLWSLGVVMYEMLAGIRPFRGESSREVADAICCATPDPPRRRAVALSPSLERIVARLLEKQPERRYRSAAELLADLAPVLYRPATTAPLRAGLAARRWRVVFITASFAVAAGSSIALLSARRVARSPIAGEVVEPLSRRTLAVLPFTNTERSADDDYLSQGLTQELTQSLSRLRSLRVVSRASALRFNASHRDLQGIGRVLKVDAVLTGIVDTSNGNRRIVMRLVNVRDGTELWSSNYELRPGEIASLQRQIALRIANALEAQLSSVERHRLGRPGTRNDEALAFYLKGRYFANQRTPAGYRLAIAYYERAITADSLYAAPWAGLAAVYSQQGMSGQLSPRQAQQRSRGAVLRAIALDDSLAEAHAVLGIYLHAYDWDSDAAEREFRRAIELDPNYALPRYYYGNMLRAVGRLGEAIAQQMTAIELDPLVPAFNESLAFTLSVAGRTNEALARVRTALELDSTYWRAHAVLGSVFEVTHRYDDALREYERANQLAGPSAHRTTGDLARVLALAGRPRDARHLLEVLQQRAVRANNYEPAVATAFHALGDDAAAYDWLEHAYRQRQPELAFLAADTRFLSMSNDPRFLELLRRLRIPR
jgi:TolB-like protein/Flp pilus assembly protein TadD